MGVKLTKRVIEAAEPADRDQYLWDAEVKGFGRGPTCCTKRLTLSSASSVAADSFSAFVISSHGLAGPASVGSAGTAFCTMFLNLSITSCARRMCLSAGRTPLGTPRRRPFGNRSITPASFNARILATQRSLPAAAAATVAALPCGVRGPEEAPPCCLQRSRPAAG